MKKSNEIEKLLHTIHVSTSPFHAVEEASKQLEEAGYTELELGTSWDIKKGNGYYIKAYGSTLFAIRVNEDYKSGQPVRIATAHTDWPCLRVKPSPEVTTNHYGKLNIEVYGAPILSTWMDRPLSLSGRISTKGSSAFKPNIRLVNFNRPLLTIPNLAIHMNREVNNGVALNPQIDLLPILMTEIENWDKNNYFLTMLAEEINVDPSEIIDFELYVYNRDKGELIGLNEEFISAPRLDNLTSVQSCLSGLIDSHHVDGIDMIALFDNEEIGSRTKQGASSTLLSNVLEKISLSLNNTRAQYLDTLFNGILLSIDVAHAIHPNKPEKCDIKNQISLNDGIAIKMSSNQSYATDTNVISIIEELCKESQIPYQKFTNRSDMKGGSTLGSITSAALSIKAVDIGVPMLAMHSSRELIGKKDQISLVSLVQAFFTSN